MSSQKLLDRVCVPERVPTDPGPLLVPAPANFNVVHYKLSIYHLIDYRYRVQVT